MISDSSYGQIRFASISSCVIHRKSEVNSPASVEKKHAIQRVNCMMAYKTVLELVSSKAIDIYLIISTETKTGLTSAAKNSQSFEFPQFSKTERTPKFAKHKAGRQPGIQRSTKFFLTQSASFERRLKMKIDLVLEASLHSII